MTIRKTRTFADLNLLFQAHPATKDIVKRYDEDAVKNSIKNLVMTKNFERPFHPEIGCQVNNLLFENATPITAELIKRSIINVIAAYEPRARVIDVRVNDQIDYNNIAVTVEFMLINNDKPITLTTLLTRVR